jgi:acyl carrier protein
MRYARLDYEKKETVVNTVRIQQIVKSCLPDTACSIFANSDLFEEFGLDSVAFVQLVVALEEEYGISFRDDDLERDNFATPIRINELVKQYCET